MKRVDQMIVSVDKGDCTRACLASILELNIAEVPNFIEKGNRWFDDFWKFIKTYGYQYYGVGWLVGPERPHGHILKESPNIDGYVIASVPSRTFEIVGHSVVMDLDGVVIHDPNPNKLWQDVNVVETGELQHWMMIGPIESI